MTSDFGEAQARQSSSFPYLKSRTKEVIYYEWEEEVSPDWAGMINLLDDEDDGDPDIEKGDYILLVYNGKDTISEGEFSVE